MATFAAPIASGSRATWWWWEIAGVTRTYKSCSLMGLGLGLGLMDVVSSVDAEQGTGACTSALLGSRGSQDVHAQDQNTCESVQAGVGDASGMTFPAL